FNQQTGCKFTTCRMPIGASDFATEWYSLNENDGDFAMEQFSVERDEQALIPYIQAAQEIYPELDVWASPWSPPSWLKVNNHYACLSDPKVNDLGPNGEGEEMQNMFRMEPKYLQAYALYFSKFVQAYGEKGINISNIHVQNEPNSCQNFPSCIWRPEALAEFIGGYLGPQFEKDNIEAGIWLGTVERPQMERIDPILQDEQAGKYIKGVGFQWAGKGAIPSVNDKYPDMDLIQTETECGDGSNDWAAAVYTFSLIKHYFDNGVNAYTYWNMILDETGKSQWGWKQNSMITIDKANKTYTYNPEFHLMKHFSYFVAPGSVSLDMTTQENVLAFKSGDKVVLFTYNPNPDDEVVELRIDDIQQKVTIPAASFNTFVIELNA
ncbi:MAG: hypothetical protein KI790_20600, partial [Cyclobacteriaceae bacterium]|nr:hypothetical protein [Cyclobacteriaceae bacterium HetDA_MAG_MS6]